MPFEVGFRSRNPYGWPQLILTLVCPDFLGREIIKGYGIVHIPTQPGRHERTLHIFSPITSNVILEFLGVLAGQKAEIIQEAKVFQTGEGREIMRTKTEGIIKVVFNISNSDFENTGY